MQTRHPLRVVSPLALSLLFATPTVGAQEQEVTSPAPMQSQRATDRESAPGAPKAMDHAMMVGPLGIARTRMGSGTAWLPDSSPMYGIMGRLGSGGFMFHENVFVGYDWFGSDRGSQRVVSTNSVMAMAWQAVGSGELTERVMLSAEPLTVTGGGYPLLFQTGETYHGQPLHDRQHPHDLFMELALDYVLPLSGALALELYAAPAGEPALGPVAFPHRISAISDPLAAIGHHWEDSTHISFGVLTAGIFTRRFKLEGSWFNGREPDENRWNLDLRVPDSYSGRFSFNPARDWSLQASYGYLRSPESSQPNASVQRVTGSVAHNAALGDGANVATTFVAGVNVERHGPTTPAALLESNFSIDGHHVVFGRAEYVRKTGEELVLPPERAADIVNVGLLGLGYVYYFGPFASLSPGVGVRGSVGFADARLEPFYGTQFPLGAMAFVQLRLAPMSM